MNRNCRIGRDPLELTAVFKCDHSASGLAANFFWAVFSAEVFGRFAL